MTLWLVVWFIVAILGTVAILVLAAALVRQGILVGRTAQRLQDEVAPLADEIGTGADRASAKVSDLRPPSFAEQRRDRRG
jgi:hypothetical protein